MKIQSKQESAIQTPSVPDCTTRTALNTECSIQSSANMENSIQLSAEAKTQIALSGEEQRRVEALTRRIDLSDPGLTTVYGADAQQALTSFAAVLRRHTRSEHFGETGEDLRELEAVIRSTQMMKKKGIFSLLFRKKQQEKELRAVCAEAERRAGEIARKLQDQQQSLLEEVFRLEQIYEKNQQTSRELAMYILAGSSALERAVQVELPQRRLHAEQSQNPMEQQRCQEYAHTCERFAQKLSELKTSRLLSDQMAAQIRLMQNTDQTLADKLRTDLMHTIPLWRAQMALTLDLKQENEVLEAGSSAVRTMQRTARSNAALLRREQARLETNQAANEANLKKLEAVTEELLETIHSVSQLQENEILRYTEAQGSLQTLVRKIEPDREE